jgi:hypothetical protein
VTAESLAKMVEQTRVSAAKAGSAGIFGRVGAGGGADCFFALGFDCLATTLESAFFGSTFGATGAGANCGGLAFCVA